MIAFAELCHVAMCSVVHTRYTDLCTDWLGCQANVASPGTAIEIEAPPKSTCTLPRATAVATYPTMCLVLVWCNFPHPQPRFALVALVQTAVVYLRMVVLTSAAYCQRGGDCTPNQT